MASKQQQGFRMCVHPCPRYLTGGDTHILCVACLGEEQHGQCSRALRCASPADAPILPGVLSRGLSVPQGSGPAAAEAQRRLRSWGSQRDLSAEVETGAASSLPSPQIKSNQITFIVTSPQHKCLGEWNSYERAPDSAKKQNNNLHMDSTYLQTVQKDNVQNTHTYTQYTQCTIKTCFVTNAPIHIIHRIYTSALCPHLCIVICEGVTDYNLQ